MPFTQSSNTEKIITRIMKRQSLGVRKHVRLDSQLISDHNWSLISCWVVWPFLCEQWEPLRVLWQESNMIRAVIWNRNCWHCLGQNWVKENPDSERTIGHQSPQHQSRTNNRVVLKVKTFHLKIKWDYLHEGIL